MPMCVWGTVTNAFTMTWTAGEGAVSYNIYWRRTAEPTYGNVINTGGTGTTYPVTWMLDGVSYTVQITAVDGDGYESDPSAETEYLDGEVVA